MPLHSWALGSSPLIAPQPSPDSTTAHPSVSVPPAGLSVRASWCAQLAQRLGWLAQAVGGPGIFLSWSCSLSMQMTALLSVAKTEDPTAEMEPCPTVAPTMPTLEISSRAQQLLASCLELCSSWESLLELPSVSACA